MNSPADAEQTLRQLVESMGVVRGKKALQKLAYLLQEGEGAPLGLNFRMFQYGPYSTDLENMVHELEVRGSLEVQAGDTFLISAKGSKDRPSHEIENVVTKFGKFPAWKLELLASLLFLERIKPFSAHGGGVDDLRSRLAAWKGTKFKPSEVDEAIEKLRSENYIQG
jgi:uncharacterized protein YwgA